MANPILIAKNAGYGVTPPCPQARFHVGQVCKVRRNRHLIGLPSICVIAIVVPPNFPPEYAHADFLKKPRPLMVSETRNCVTYIVGFENNPRPMVLGEKSLSHSEHPDSTITWAGDAV